MNSGPGLASSVHHWFESIALALPDKVAISDETGDVRYSELYQLAKQLKFQLELAGVGRGAPVALFCGRSASAIAAMLAVSMTGGCFIPLDTQQPSGQLAFILADIKPLVVIADRENSARLNELCYGGPVLVLGANSTNPASVQGNQISNCADDAFYVMFTSGSTGQPKGVVVPHRAVLRLVTNQTYADFSSDDVFLNLSPLAFDASTFEIWGALLNGARLAVISNPIPSLDDIANAITRYGVTNLWLTAGLFNLMVDHRLSALTSVRTIIAGGDILSPKHVAKAYARLPNTRIVNGYGPTENTTFTCCYDVPRAHDSSVAIPIGRPINDTSVVILDDDLQPVSDGTEGQLCVGGAGLALGYLNRPELTAERFIDNHLTFIASDKLYLTGDRVRRRQDDALEFLGRIDRQVKINGKRVEIDGVEAVIRSDRRVKDAAVTIEEFGANARRLIGWVIAEPGVSESGLLGDMRAKLPAESVPAAIVVIDRFPLTPNGKVDRASLKRSQTANGPRPALQSSGVEASVAAIWRDVLGVDSMSMDTNFFDLGGTSLQMVAVHAELQRSVGPGIALVELFEFTSIRSLARRIENVTPAKETAIAAARARGAKQNAALANLQRNRPSPC